MAAVLVALGAGNSGFDQSNKAVHHFDGMLVLLKELIDGFNVEELKC